jgi:glycerol-3-phosphate dehydrogenase
VAESVIRQPGRPPVRLAKGSHIVVKRLFDHDRGYILQSTDNRVVFALPFHGDFTLIGTTDEEFVGDPATVAPSSDDINYLCRAMNEYFRDVLLPVDAVWAYAGVRSLYDDGSAAPEDVTRDYVLALDQAFRSAPLMTVYGGKITTYRRLAEAAVGKIADRFVAGPAWTKDAPLPGGDFPHDQLAGEIARTRARWPFLSEGDAQRLVSAYGTRVGRVLGNAASAADLGLHFGAGLSAAEVRYLMQHEWAETADDVLWRRSKLALRMSEPERAALAQFIAAEGQRAAS